MKILKYVVGVLILLFVGFFLIGLIWPKFTYTSQVIVNASVEKSWAVFTDETKMAEWMPGFKSIENISGEPLQVGSEWKLTVEDQGQIFEMTERVTAVKVQEKYAFWLDNDVLNANVEIYFAAVDSATTEITANTQTIAKGVVWKSMLFLMKGNISEQDQENYNNLKRVIESSDYTPKTEVMENPGTQSE